MSNAIGKWQVTGALKEISVVLWGCVRIQEWMGNVGRIYNALSFISFSIFKLCFLNIPRCERWSWNQSSEVLCILYGFRKWKTGLVLTLELEFFLRFCMVFIITKLIWFQKNSYINPQDQAFLKGFLYLKWVTINWKFSSQFSSFFFGEFNAHVP